MENLNIVKVSGNLIDLLYQDFLNDLYFWFRVTPYLQENLENLTVDITISLENWNINIEKLNFELLITIQLKI